MCAAPYRTRSPGSLGNLPARASTSRARLHSSRRREQPVTSCAPGCVIHYATQRRRQNCFYACVHYVHTSREPSASPFPASSHKIAFCLLRPPGARPPFPALRLTPLAPFAPQGAGALVGPTPARAARTASGPPRSPRSRRKVYRPATIAPGFAKPQPDTLVANPPEEDADIFFFSRQRKAGRLKEKMFLGRGVSGMGG